MTGIDHLIEAASTSADFEKEVRMTNLRKALLYLISSLCALIPTSLYSQTSLVYAASIGTGTHHITGTDYSDSCGVSSYDGNYTNTEERASNPRLHHSTQRVYAAM